MTPLPIDSLLGEIVSTLGAQTSLVLEAAPGAGKTTRAPPALLDAGIAAEKEILVLEPRRLAARLPARFVAQARASVSVKASAFKFDTKARWAHTRASSTSPRRSFCAGSWLVRA